MQRQLRQLLATAFMLALIVSVGLVTESEAGRNPCNPCAVKMNPCNPCTGKPINPCNPCAAKNPCNPCAAQDRIDPKLVSRPAGSTIYTANKDDLIAEGKRLWEDRSLGNSNLACSNCHTNYGNLQASFLKPYPHKVDMPFQRAGLKQVQADEMVQFCMVVPMAAKPFAWDSQQLAALTAYTQEVQQQFMQAAAANPCMLKPATANPCNPCAAKNPCNPCAAKRMHPYNPCARKMNPCNPCAAHNPCTKQKW